MNNLARNLAFLRSQKGLKQAEMAEKLGISRNTVSNWENSVSQPNVEEIFAIANLLDISIDELITTDLTGAHLSLVESDGEKLGKSTPKSTPKRTPNQVSEPEMKAWDRMPKLVTVDSTGRDNVVLVPVRARAGYLAGYEDPEYLENLPAYRLPNLSHGTFRMFEVYGHSMVPTFHESDIIIARYVENLLEIRDDRIYVIVSKREGVVVKRCVNRVQKSGKLILNSDNQRHAGEYPPIVISPEDVLEIWYATAFMSRQMRAPGELYNRLIDVESRLTLLEDNAKKLNGK